MIASVSIFTLILMYSSDWKNVQQIKEIYFQSSCIAMVIVARQTDGGSWSFIQWADRVEEQ